MSDETIYSVSVNARNGSQLLWISGRRETVIEAALRVILDHAPAWDVGFSPTFTITAQAIK